MEVHGGDTTLLAVLCCSRKRFLARNLPHLLHLVHSLGKAVWRSLISVVIVGQFFKHERLLLLLFLDELERLKPADLWHLTVGLALLVWSCPAITMIPVTDGVHGLTAQMQCRAI